MMVFRSMWRGWVLRAPAAFVAMLVLGAAAATANPSLVVDVDSGEVLFEDMATAPWFPASLTKLMTTYVALSKVREGRLTLDTPLRVTARAAAMAPSKMGFRPGTLVTLDNALKMLMVKSPNDVAVTIAEGVSGSVEGFADEMNAYGAKLGLRESHFVNPNGLPDERHVSSARDMALIGRALLREFPEEHALFGIGALAFGGRIINNHNGLLGRYDGVDGMKTGYTCSAGYNIVASAQRGDRRLIVVVMGSPTLNERSQKATTLFERFFAGAGGGGAGDLAALPASDIVFPPDLRGQICGPGRRNAIMEAEADDAVIPLAPAGPMMFARSSERAQVLAMAAAPAPPVIAQSGAVELLHARAPFEPVRVYIGPAPGWTGSAAGPPVEMAAPGPGRVRAAAVALAKPDPGTGDQPMALLGAVPQPAALAAANRVVKAKGRLSLHAAPAARNNAAKPARVAAAGKARTPAPVATKPAAPRGKARTKSAAGPSKTIAR